jgi:hypothetical protein
MRRTRFTARRVTARRRGSALLLVLVAMVVLAVLSSASMMSAFQEARSSRAAQIQQRALTVAEFALNQQLSNWRPQRQSMAMGAIDSMAVGVDLGDTAIVRVQRLTSTDFNVVSVGRAGIGNGLMEAQREVSMLVTFRAPTVRPGGILTSFGDVDVQGSPTLSGRNTTPPGWPACATAARDTFAISYNPSSRISVQKPASQAIGGTRADPRAADPRNYDTFGTDTWASMIARANVRVTGNISPSPTGSSTTCNTFSSNWGEPRRGMGTVAGCMDYFPIIYSPGDLDLQTGRGQGILIVDGRLRIRGNFEFVGLILVRDEFEAEGNMSLHGAVMSRNADNAETRVRGNGTLMYSRCAVDRALGALATPTRAKERAWANIY